MIKNPQKTVVIVIEDSRQRRQHTKATVHHRFWKLRHQKLPFRSSEEEIHSILEILASMVQFHVQDQTVTSWALPSSVIWRWGLVSQRHLWRFQIVVVAALPILGLK